MGRPANYQRCGPLFREMDEHSEPLPAHTFPTCTPAPNGGVGNLGGEESGHFQELAGVAVDQATGNVYVLNSNIEFGNRRERNEVEVFTATGTAIGTGFGDAGPSRHRNRSLEGPGKVHNIPVASRPIALRRATHHNHKSADACHCNGE